MAMEEMVERMRRNPNFEVEQQEEGEDDTYFVKVRGSPRVSGIMQRLFFNATAKLTIDYGGTFDGGGLATETAMLMELEYVRTHALQSGIQPHEIYPRGQSRSEYLAQLRDVVDGLSRLVGEMR